MVKNEQCTILWYVMILTDHLSEHRRPDLVKKKKNRKKAGRCVVVDFPIPYAIRVNIKKIE